MKDLSPRWLYLPMFFLLSFLPGQAWGQKGEPASKIAAEVNTIPVYEHQLAAEVERQLQKYARYGMRRATPELVAILRAQARDQLIEQEIVRQASIGIIIHDLAERADRRIAEVQARFRTPQGFTGYLETQQMTLEEFREAQKDKIRLEAYLANLYRQAGEPSAEEVARYYQTAKENFKRKERVRVRHILIGVDQGDPPAEQAEARRRAEEVLALLKAEPAKFPEMAARVSDCRSSKDQGGDLGAVKRGSMPASFESAAFSLPVGQLSGIIATRFGYHILEVLERSPAGYASLEEVESFLRRYLQERKQSEQLAVHLQELKEKAVVKMY